MFVYVWKHTGRVIDASNLTPWQSYLDPETQEIREVEGDENTYRWPNGDRTRCLLTKAGEIVPDPDWVKPDDAKDAHEAAVAAVKAAAEDRAVPESVRNALDAITASIEALRASLERRPA